MQIVKSNLILTILCSNLSRSQKEQYYKKLTKILHYYTDFEILASAENTEDEKTIVQRICGIYRKYINVSDLNWIGLTAFMHIYAIFYVCLVPS